MTGVPFVDDAAPSVPTVLPWLARWAADGDLLAIARIALVHTAVAAPLTWPVVADAVAMVLADRTRLQPVLAKDLIEVLPQIAGYLDPDRVAAMSRFNVRPDALAFASLAGAESTLGEDALETMSPSWRPVLAAERTSAVPPLTNFRLLGSLVGGPQRPLSKLTGSDLAYLLPYVTSLDTQRTRQELVQEVQRWSGEEPPWYAAAVLARIAPYLVDDDRAKLRKARPDHDDARWTMAIDSLCRGDLAPWESPILELAAAYPATADLDQFAGQATGKEVAVACADIIRGFLADLDPQAPERWEPPTPSADGLDIVHNLERVIRPELLEFSQVTLSAVQGQVGAGDGIQLPGFSSGYRLLRFKCPAEGCTELEYRIYYDKNNLPECNGHSRLMELDYEYR